MSFAEVRVGVHRATDPPAIAGPPTIRFVAPGSMTAGRYGLFEYHQPAHGPGPGPHIHKTFSESFYVLSGMLSIYDGAGWSGFGAGDYAHVPEGGAHAFRNDADEETRFLILFAPGIARENFFLELAEIRRAGRVLDQQEWVDFYARHDQVNL